MKKKETDFEELMKNVDYTRWLQVIIPLMQPILMFGAWIAFSRFDKRADALSKLIAVVEPLPTVDLNLPRSVVLASLYHSLEEAMGFWPDDIIPEQVKEFFETEIQVPEEDETWQSFLERRLRETGLFGK